MVFLIDRTAVECEETIRKYQVGARYSTLKTQVVVRSKENWRSEFHFDQRGLLHREPDEGPAVRINDANGDLWEVEYVWHGWRHREDGPALIKYEPGNHPCIQEWYRFGWIHRRDGPANVTRLNGKDWDTEAFYLHGYRFRDPRRGPRVIEYDDQGTVKWDCYTDETPPRPEPSRRWLQQTYGFVRPGRPI